MGFNLLRYRKLERYKETVSKVAPLLPRALLDRWSITEADAFVLARLLRRLRQEVTVLEIGTFLGVSCFHFACQPNVKRVVSVDPNPLLTEELRGTISSAHNMGGYGALTDKKVLEITEDALARFPREKEKIELRRGVVGYNRVNLAGEHISDIEKVEVPQEPLVAFIDGLHVPEAVYDDLAAVFQQNQSTLALLHDCRGDWGPFVQAGVAAFLEAFNGYCFYLFERLGPRMDIPNLGMVYPEGRHSELEPILLELASMRRTIFIAMRDSLAAR